MSANPAQVNAVDENRWIEGFDQRGATGCLEIHIIGRAVAYESGVVVERLGGAQVLLEIPTEQANERV